ncbi:HTH-type transcriptional activator Btr [compost metagenome]
MTLITEHLQACGLVESSWVKARAASFPKHTHDEYVLGVNLVGTERVWLDGKVMDAPPGSVTFYNPLAVQGSEFGPEGVEYISLHIAPQALRQVIADNHLDHPPTCPTFEQGVLHNKALFQAIVEFARVPPEQAALREEAFLGLLCQLLERTPGKAAEQSDNLKHAREFMHAHLGQKLELDELAKVAGLSKYHFVRCFKKETGLAPLQYQMQLRLIEARRRLRRREHPLDVATALGFYDQSHFINAYRKVMGITPQAYSAALRN